MKPSLLLDEDIHFDLAHALRVRGFDAVHTQELERKGRPDEDQLEYAASQQRCLLTFIEAVKGTTPPKTHNLRLLALETGLTPTLSTDQENLLRLLEPLNIQARYPEHKAALERELTRGRCAEILEETKEFSRWIEQRLCARPPNTQGESGA